MGEKKYTVESVGARIEEFLAAVLKQARFHVTPEVSEPEPYFPDFENPDLMVKFTGPDVDLLLANKGEVLLALEHLTMEMLGMAPNEHTLLVFDANDYRILRIEELRLSALKAAEEVKLGHRPFRFNPMTSRERRILHIALRNETEVRSESQGSGPFRGVVIYPKDMPSEPEPAPQRGFNGPRRRGRR